MSGPRILYDGIHLSAPGANTNILSTALVPKAGELKFRIEVCLATSSVFKAIVTNGGTTVGIKANSGDALVADSGYTFDLDVTPSDSVNFQVVTDSVIERLLVKAITDESA